MSVEIAVSCGAGEEKQPFMEIRPRKITLLKWHLKKKIRIWASVVGFFEIADVI